MSPVSTEPNNSPVTDAEMYCKELILRVRTAFAELNKRGFWCREHYGADHDYTAAVLAGMMCNDLSLRGEDDPPELLYAFYTWPDQKRLSQSGDLLISYGSALEMDIVYDDDDLFNEDELHLHAGMRAAMALVEANLTVIWDQDTENRILVRLPPPGCQGEWIKMWSPITPESTQCWQEPICIELGDGYCPNLSDMAPATWE